MAEDQDFKPRSSGDTPYIREKIVKRPMTKKQILQRIAVWLFCAVIFGAAAGTTFALVSPLVSGLQHKGSAGVQFETEPPATVPETAAEPTAEASSQEVSTEVTVEQTTSTQVNIEATLDSRIGAIVDRKLAAQTYDVTDLQALQAIQTGVSDTFARTMVEVHVVKQDVDWFQQVYEDEREVSGFVVYVTDSEVLVLVSLRNIQGAQSISITFGDDTIAAAAVKEQDALTGMAILSVPLASISASTASGLSQIRMGNSDAVSLGAPVIAMGCPLGRAVSLAYTYVSYIKEEVDITDSAFTMLYTQLPATEGGAGVLVNLKGEVVGWIVESYRDSGMEGYTAAMGISDIKTTLQNLCNGIATPYFGVVGETIDERTAVQQKLPQGIYLTVVEEAGPAFTAGLQAGDVITAVDGEPVLTMRQLQKALSKYAPEEVITVTAIRMSRDAGNELTFSVALMKR